MSNTIRHLLLLIIGLPLCLWASVPAAELRFRFNSASGGEDVNLVGIEVLLDVPQPQPVSVRVAYAGGTATTSTDGASTGIDAVLPDSDRITIPAGETSAFLEIEITDDRAVEPNETLIFDLAQPSGATLASPTRHTYTIVENDGPRGGSGPGLPIIEFSSEQSEVDESSTTVEVSIKANRQIDEFDTQPVEVELEVTSGTATLHDDYTLELLEPMVFAENEVIVNARIRILEDSISEENEKLTLKLINPQNSQIGTDSLHTITINDNDPASVRWDIAETTISERQSTFTLTAILANAADRDVDVQYTLLGTASRGDDYRAAPATPLRFISGTTTSQLTFSIIDDHVEEPDEQIIATLMAGTGTTITTPSVATINIDDSGPWPKVAFEEAAVSRSETITSSSVYVVLDRPSSDTVVVKWRLDAPNTTAVYNTDHRNFNGEVSIPPGQTLAPISVQVINDNLEEGDETIGLRLEDPEFALLGETQRMVYTILDNDEPLKPLTLFSQELPTADHDKLLKLIGPLTFALSPAGLGLDAADNLYISDQGPTRAPGQGRLLFVPKRSKDALTLISALDRPGDVELSNDQRYVLILGPDGQITKRALGVSIFFRNIDPTGNMTVTLKTDTGSHSARASEDRHFHFLDLLEPGQVSATARMIIERDGRAISYPIEIGYPPTGTLTKRFGHRLHTFNYAE